MVDEANVTNPLVKMHLKRWIEENLRPDISFSQVPFEELVKDWEDLTLQEAKTMAYKDERIATLLKGEEEPEENPLLERFMQDIQTARSVGVEDRQLLNALRKVGLDLEKPTSAGLAASKREVERLTKDLEEAKKAEVESPPAPAAEPVKKPVEKMRPIFTIEQEDLLFNSFKSLISRKFKRDLTSNEVNQFEEMVGKINRVTPKLTFFQAKKQIDDLARSIAAIGQAGRIIVRGGIERQKELLDKMLSQSLEPEEQEELTRLEASAARFSEQEIIYAPPRLKVIADSGPLKTKYPFDLGSYWDMTSAEQEAERLQGLGYIVRIEEIV